jgi:hypothetical protein
MIAKIEQTKWLVLGLQCGVLCVSSLSCQTTSSKPDIDQKGSAPSTTMAPPVQPDNSKTLQVDSSSLFSNRQFRIFNTAWPLTTQMPLQTLGRTCCLMRATTRRRCRREACCHRQSRVELISKLQRPQRSRGAQVQ